VPSEVTLYAPNGKPIDRGKTEKSLLKALSFSSLSDWQEAVIGGLSPADLATIYSDAAAKDGDPSRFLTFAEELEERDGHYAGQLSVRRTAAEGVEYVLTGGDKAIREELTAMLKPILVDGLGAWTDGLGKGYGVGRVIWEQFNNRWMIAGFEWVDPHWFRWQDNIPKLRSEDGKKLLDLPPFVFAVHLPRLKNGTPIRGGLSRRCGFLHLAKSFSLRDWLGLSKVYGLPIPIGRYYEGADDEEKKTLLKLVKQLRSNGGGILPFNSTIEMLQNTSAANGQAVYGGLYELINREMSKAILGQVGTADGGQGNSKQTEMGEVRQDILEKDARNLALTINRQIIRPWCWLNFGRVDIAPVCVPGISRVKDFLAFAKGIKELVNCGLPVSAEALHEHLPFRPPAEGETLLKPIQSASKSSTENNDDEPNDEEVSDDDED
jgi:phage gp29-like protein